MHRQAILVVAADLQRAGTCDDLTRVRVGPETARVCRAAAQRARDHPDAFVYATAGGSPKFKVIMGSGPMREFLIGCGIQPERIRTPVASIFNTNGEAAVFVEDFFRSEAFQDTDTAVIHLVCRWWHLPRAWLLLRARIGWNRMHTNVWIRPVPVWTFADIPGMLLEPGAWLKNLRFMH